MNLEAVASRVEYSAHSTIREAIYQRLKEVIVSGELAMGERIVEKAYAEAFRVSRTPVREGLKRLEEEGYVRHIPGTGVIVTGVNRSDVVEVFRIRKNLERMILEEVVAHGTPSDFQAIEAILKHGEEGDFASGEALTKIFEEFHNELQRISQLRRTSSMIRELKSYVKRFREISARCDKRRKAIEKEHRGIFEALRSGDLELAVQLNDQHLEHSMETVLKHLFKA